MVVKKEGHQTIWSVAPVSMIQGIGWDEDVVCVRAFKQ
jgi:hypothetical protein